MMDIPFGLTKEGYEMQFGVVSIISLACMTTDLSSSPFVCIQLLFVFNHAKEEETLMSVFLSATTTMMNISNSINTLTLIDNRIIWAITP